MIGESMYQELILEHYKHPQGRGLREPYDTEVHHVNPTCGDEITLRVKVGDGGEIIDVSYDGQGCSISQAAASVLHELATGSTVDETLSVVDEFTRLMQGRGRVEADEEVLGDAVAFAGVAKFPARVKCALLSWMAYKDAVVRSAR
ncbi:SUF system NifU family Fe-S cluster assembly protein [Nonomuraea phyllanthi]|uniref:SUF system NifU family Fe-S cluster assembly protein n=1 Tax=Nonomuraea phyllanthi TaxID=2219224 RepID=A0A5C4WN88_9ACTN|nr:SUF system NifU family Fe-S cluster assembly protein [Nonomuraea phyllanthi]KAB8195105.1 SUF system NifU family Fe-S cluster assembly protein [Nonomuraea phyllanthi]QFY10763.1 SUF system NifU family Fe-S cluster assembly protein [Nonomuraea phyllanthi]